MEAEGYVITIHDVAARLLCMSLEEQYYRRMGQQPPIKADYQSWASHLGFDSEEWHEKVQKAINGLNSLRNEYSEDQKMFNASAKVESSSWSMGCALKVLPRMRRKMQEAKWRIK